MRATTCSLGRVAFGRARGRGEFERVAAAHEDLSVCVPMCSRLPPGELAWGRAPGETRGRGNAMPQPWKLRLHHRFSEDLFGLALTTKAPCGPGRRFETMQAGVASRSWAPDVADRRRGRGTRTSRRQRRVAVRAAQTGTRDDSGMSRRGTPGLTWGPRATDGAPTGSLRPRRRPRLCPRSTHRNPGSKSTRSPRRRAGQRWQPRASSPR